jgi:hypothetical protein
MLRFGPEYPSRGDPPIGRVTEGRIFRFEPQKYVRYFFLHILQHSIIFFNSLSLFSTEIYIITAVTIFLQQRMKLQLHS